MDAQSLNGLVYELKNMLDRINKYQENHEYVYADTFKNWVGRFNKNTKLYSQKLSIPIQPYEIDEWDYSSTQKTMRRDAVETFITSIRNLISKVEEDVDYFRRKEQAKQIPFHQLRKCFKTSVDRCPVNPPLKRNKVFIGMPFLDKHEDSFKFGIAQALESLGYTYFRADKQLSNHDIMCKICSELQSCDLAIINISDLNPNVMLELGLAYGIGKPVIILKDKETRAISDLGSIEYIEYAHAHDLMLKLQKALQGLF